MAGPIRVEAPDALMGFLLTQRLLPAAAEVMPVGDAWEVHVQSTEPLETVLDVVQRWLDDERLLLTTVHLDDGRTFTLTGRLLRLGPRRRRAGRKTSPKRR